MTDSKNFSNLHLTPSQNISTKDLIKFGRWLCYQFYRDARELQLMFGVHEIDETFSAIIQLDSAFGELLAGGYRFAQFQVAKSRAGNKVKWSRLGEVIWPNVLSIDGVGAVRAKEIILYELVARELIDRLHLEL